MQILQAPGEATPGSGSTTLITSPMNLGDSVSATLYSGTLRFDNLRAAPPPWVRTSTSLLLKRATLQLSGLLFRRWEPVIAAIDLSTGYLENVASIVNNSQATIGGVLVDGTNQHVGTITGTGNLIVAAASSDNVSGHSERFAAPRHAIEPLNGDACSVGRSASDRQSDGAKQ